MNKYKKLALTVTATTLFAQSASAVIFAHFEQVSNDVILSFDGSLNVNPLLANDAFLSTLSGSSGISQLAGLYGYTENYYFDSVGSSSLSAFSVDYSASGTDVTGTFGMVGGNLSWASSSISGGSVGAVSQLSTAAASNNIIFRNVTLSADRVNAMNTETVIFTATTTGDTIVLSNTKFAPVPEPSSTALLGLGALGLIIRRKR
jgi:hypothetical protein